MVLYIVKVNIYFNKQIYIFYVLYFGNINRIYIRNIQNSKNILNNQNILMVKYIKVLTLVY